MCTANFHCIIN